MRRLRMTLANIVWTAYASVLLFLAAVAIVVFTPYVALAAILAAGSISAAILTAYERKTY